MFPVGVVSHETRREGEITEAKFQSPSPATGAEGGVGSVGERGKAAGERPRETVELLWEGWA